MENSLLQKKKKKLNHAKEGELVPKNSSEELSVEMCETKEKKKKNKKGNPVKDEESDQSISSLEKDGILPSNKKKKGNKKSDELNLMKSGDAGSNSFGLKESIGKIPKKKRKQSKETDTLDNGISDKKASNQCDDDETTSKKKKKHNKKMLQVQSETSNSGEKDDTTDKTSRKKKKHNKETSQVESKTSNLCENDETTVASSARKPKKHKRKRKHTDHDQESEENLLQNDDLVPSPSKTMKTADDPHMCNGTDTLEVKKKKSKKKKPELIVESNCDESENSKSKISKKKKKKEKGLDELTVINEIGISSEGNMSSLTSATEKKKKNQSEDTGSEKGYIRIKEKPVSVGELKGESNEEEISLNSSSDKKKKKKGKHNKNSDSKELCQNSSDHEMEKMTSGTTEKPDLSTNLHSKTLSSKASTNIDEASVATNLQSQLVQGQWQGDLFNSADRQNKFLRLLGGMKKTPPGTDSIKSNSKKLFQSSASGQKKGLFGSLASRVGGSAAMSVSDAASLDQKLEEDYNRAMDWKLNKKKGTGFGFVPDPAEGKKFHIDVNKTNSLKFDD